MGFAQGRSTQLMLACVLALLFVNGRRLPAEDDPASDSIRLPTDIHDSTEAEDPIEDAKGTAADQNGPERKGLGEELRKLDATLANDSQDLAARRRRAEIHLELGENNLALADADRLIAERPGEGSYHRLRGKIHGKLEDYEQVIADFSEALHLDPEDADSYRERGIAYYETDNYKSAALDLGSATLRHPDDETARGYLAAVLSQLGKYEDAIREADYLVEKSPADASNLRLRGHIQQDWGFFDKGLADLSQAIRLDPKDAKAHGACARIYSAQCRNEEAVAALNHAIERRPKQTEIYYIRATAHCAMANWPAALADLDALLRVYPTLPEPRVQRAAVLALAGDRERAKAEYSAAATALAPRAIAPWQDSLFEATAQAPEQQGIGRGPEADNILAEFTVADCRFVVVPVRVGGKTLRMVLDTGSGATLFDRSHQDFLGPETGKTRLNTPGGAVKGSRHGPISLSLGTIESISTRGATFSLDLSTLHRSVGFQLDGILGMDVLSQFVFQLDICGRRAYLLKSCPADAGVAIPLVDAAISQTRTGNELAVYPQPEVLLTLPGGTTAPFLLDTGWEAGSLALGSESYGQIVDHGGIVPLGENLGASMGRIDTLPFGVLKTIQLGDFHHQNLIVYETQRGNILGLNYLSRFVVTFDFPGRRLMLKPSPLFAVSEAERTLRLGNKLIDGVRAASAAELMQTLDDLIRADPGNPARYMHRANYFAMHKEYDKAIADLDLMIRLNPRDATSFYARGTVYFHKHDADRAIADFDKAIALDPAMTSAWRNRGLARATKRDFDGALQDLDEALRLNPTYKEAAEDRRLVLAASEKNSAKVANHKEVAPQTVAPRACCAKNCRARCFLRSWRQRRRRPAACHWAPGQCAPLKSVVADLCYSAIDG